MILAHSWLNLFRNRRRTIMAIILLVLSMVLVYLAFSYLEGMYWALRYGYSMRNGSIQIAAQGYWDEKMGSKPVIDPAKLSELSAILKADKSVDSFSQELTFSGLIGTERSSTVVNGVAVELNAKGGGGSGFSINQGRRILSPDRNEIILGAGVARIINVKPGDWVTLISQTKDGALNPLSFQVVGIGSTGIKDVDNFFAISDLDSIRKLLLTDSSERLLVFLKQGVTPQSMIQRLEPDLKQMHLEAKTWMELSPTYFDLKGFYDSIFYFMIGIIIVLVCISIFELTSITFFERFREIGTLRAIGTKKSQIFLLLITEVLLLFVVSAVFTIGIGWGMGSFIDSMDLMWRPPGSSTKVPFLLLLKWENFTIPLIIGFTALLPAAIFPAIWSSNLSVMEVLRNE